MAVNIPGSFAGSENVVLVSSYGIYDREFRKALGLKVPRAGMLSWMRPMGLMQEKKNVIRDEFYYYEEGNHLNMTATIANSSASGNDVIVTLSEADHSRSGAVSFPIVGNTVVFSDETTGLVIAKDTTTPNAHTVTIRRTDTSLNVVSAAVIGTPVLFYGTAFQEASDAPEGRVPQIDKVTNKMVTSRAVYSHTDFAGQNHTEFNYNGQTLLHYKGIDDTADRFEFEEELGLLLGRNSADLQNAASQSVQTAKGYINQVTDSGNVLEYTDSPALADIEEAVLTLNKSFSDRDYIVSSGINYSLKNNKIVLELSDGGDRQINYNSFTGGAEQAVSLNFKSISYTGYTFHFHLSESMSHSSSLGAEGLPYADMALFIPNGKTKNPVAGQAAGIDSNDLAPYIQVAYVKPGVAPSADRGDYAMWETGALGSKGPTNNIMNKVVNFYSRKGIEVRALNKHLIFRKG
jgi:hypothetical protein